MVPWLRTVGVGQVTLRLSVRHWNWGVVSILTVWGIVLALQAVTPATPPQNKVASSACPHSQRCRVQGVFLVPSQLRPGKREGPLQLEVGRGRFTEESVEFLVSRFRCGRNTRALLPGNLESTLSTA